MADLSTESPLRVVVGEDQPLYREGVVHVLEASGVNVVASTGSADDLVRKARAHSPDVAIIDIQMPPSLGDDGLLAAQEIRGGDPRIGILVLSQFLEDRYALTLLGDRPEGTGYLLKDRLADVQSFVDAVHRISRGGSVIDSEVVGRLVGRRRRRDPLEPLTPRERDVLDLMAQGKSNHGIADALSVTISAVERHITSIFAKLDIPHHPSEHRRVLAALRYHNR
jgi:DNA-binding NarL/FixJ family response regulator